ncbi:MAG: ATP-binding protein [Alphaproteobacteria bacterium]|nr:ATP-binding protein [Alphaproteobacteria bacterium]
MKDFIIKRPQYIKELFSFKDTDLIKILTGVRRCGKSTVYELYAEELKKQGISPEQIQIIKLEEDENSDLWDYHKLHKHVMDHSVKGKKNYVFLDEIQNVEHFEKAVRSLYEKKNIDLYLTGSNSKLQSGEWATSLTGRYIEIKMYPLSFKEFLSIAPTDNLDKAYADYLAYSSFPYAQYFVRLNTPDLKKQIDTYLNGIYDTVVLYDVMSKKNITNAGRIKRIMKFMAGNIGSEISVKKMSDMLKNDGIILQPGVLDDYLDAFKNAYIWYQADRYDVRGRKVLKTQNKHYLVDMGIRNMLVSNKIGDTGHILENVVYLELLRRGCKVYVGKIDYKTKERNGATAEIDFVAETPDGLEYYQVCDTMNDPKTLERELASLKLIKDNYPKFILTRDYGTKDYEGIKQQNVLEWLAK